MGGCNVNQLIVGSATDLPVVKVESNECFWRLEFCSSHHAESQWTTPTDHHYILSLDLPTVHSVHRTGEGLDEHSMERRDCLWDLVDN